MSCCFSLYRLYTDVRVMSSCADVRVSSVRYACIHAVRMVSVSAACACVVRVRDGEGGYSVIHADVTHVMSGT